MLLAVVGSLGCAGGAAAATSTYLADGSASDSTSTHPGRWVGTPAYTQGDTADPSDRAFSFDGTQRIVMDGEVGRARRSDLTISFAFKTTSTQHQGFIEKRSICNEDSRGWWDLRGGPADVGVATGDTNSWKASVVPRTINDGAWHQVVIRRTAIALGLTIDGQTHVTPVMAHDINNPTTPLSISGSPCNGIDGTHPFVGAIDDLVITQVNDCSDDPPGDPREYVGMGFPSGSRPLIGSVAPVTWLLIGLGAALATGVAAALRRRRWRPAMPGSQTGLTSA